MAWESPKTNWKTGDVPTSGDFNRIEENILENNNEVNEKVSKNGDTMTGPLVAQANTNYTARQVRNMIISTGEPISSQMQNGDIWVKYR